MFELFNIGFIDILAKVNISELQKLNHVSEIRESCHETETRKTKTKNETKEIVHFGHHASLGLRNAQFLKHRN